MIHIVNLGISKKQNSGRIETEPNFIFTKNQKATFTSSKGRQKSKGRRL